MSESANKALGPSAPEFRVYREPQTPIGWQLYRRAGRVVPALWQCGAKHFAILTLDDSLMRQAIVNDNHGPWWAASSYYDAHKINMLRLHQRFSSHLCARLGGVLGCPEMKRIGWIYVQLRAGDSRDEWRQTETELSRTQITLQHRVGHAEFALAPEKSATRRGEMP